MDFLRPVIQPYAWGSRQVLADFQGRPVPSAGPEAEMWMGAHPKAPSGVVRDGDEKTLDAVVAADPARELGGECRERFGGRLPFLLKILAAEKALSIQVHPDRAQARAGFAAEQGRPGPPTYVDDWPKPELLCALTPFEVLAGFRGAAEAADVLDALGLAELGPVSAALRADGGPERLTEALRLVLTWPGPERSRLLDAVVAASGRAAARGGTHAAAYDAVVRMAADHPGDIGLLASLLFQHMVLEPGTALFMPAGGLHAYITGVGVELLANSDNVLRAGLTPKHIDIPELLRIVDPAVEVPVLAPRALPAAPAVSTYDSTAPEFRLYRCTLNGEPVEVPAAGPRIALCVEGSATLRDAGGSELKLSRGESCFLSAADGAVVADGRASVFIAAVG
ncbi:mannose-6-phosphate isomerase, class I [Streptomyces sp. MP131-18]|uniref:mannose-6-phosphate isomerase, class I n=1 Tax=Streptomyces sp. MP131-18 TaxID=1857892 RepID=UPI00097C8795|nr:mannose-6-phosphate isomerase, class I [Streptomyces sp. MP131-18]ONK16096.1 Mannose-6-phosphate isomerase [Streptomyces sp. MP131-18]